MTNNTTLCQLCQSPIGDGDHVSGHRVCAICRRGGGSAPQPTSDAEYSPMTPARQAGAYNMLRAISASAGRITHDRMTQLAEDLQRDHIYWNLAAVQAQRQLADLGRIHGSLLAENEQLREQLSQYRDPGYAPETAIWEGLASDLNVRLDAITSSLGRLGAIVEGVES